VTPVRIFISSVQKEFADERRALFDYIRRDPLLRRFYDVLLFEDLPASGRRPDETYLAEVDRCGIYLCLLGNEYGRADTDGRSPTEREFDRATAGGKERLVFVKGSDDSVRDSKVLALLHKVDGQLIRRRFGSVPELTAEVYASLVEHLDRTGTLRTRPFDASACADATLDDISQEKVGEFLSRAQQSRGYALGPSTRVRKALAHLNLLDGSLPNNAAVLLFGKQPQRFLASSEVKCLHFHGTEVSKPIPSYQIYKGTVFELVNQSLDFVLSKIARSIGTRVGGPTAPATYEVPPEAVGEAIINAVAHRDYASNASIQVMLFSDRLEVWNPGQLPPSLSPEALRVPHPSIPRNPLIAEPLFLTRYIEKAGTGTLDMIEQCARAGLPPPEFRQNGEQFVQVLWRPRRDRIISAKTGDLVGTKLGLSGDQVEVLRTCVAEMSISELMDVAGRANRTKFRNSVLKPLMQAGLIEMTIPDRPRSSNQKYRVTERGRALLSGRDTP
jgi:predicted HTH transcriptional regulator